MKRIIMWLVIAFCLIIVFIVYAFGRGGKNGESQNEGNELYDAEYSNLVDNETENIVRGNLIAAGIDSETVNLWLSDVNNYNETIQQTSLVLSGFDKLNDSVPLYDENRIMDLWTGKYNMFIGYNCRITAYLLMKEYIEADEGAEADKSLLFMDIDALEYAPDKRFTEDEMAVYERLFSGVDTSDLADTGIQTETFLNEWKNRGITFSDKTEARLISVVLHSNYGDGDNKLFIGHTGVLVPTEDNRYMFIEKMSFSLPYQVIRFDNKIQLKNYLMKMYDVEWGQENARPFILENDKVME